MTSTPFQTISPLNFFDGISSRFPGTPNARNVSSLLLTEKPKKLAREYGYMERANGLSPDAHGRSLFSALFLQFSAHDVARNKVTFGCNIPILDESDPLYEAQAPLELRNNTAIAANYPRNVLLSFPAFGTTNTQGQFVGINDVTHFFDGSVIYGSDESTAKKLRMNDGTGRMNLTRDGLLPEIRIVDRSGNVLRHGIEVESQCGGFGTTSSAAGDFRADENPGLNAIHVLFVRNHNYYAEKIRNDKWKKIKNHCDNNSTCIDENIFQEARKWNAAEFQNILINEAFPELVGELSWGRLLEPFSGYNDSVDASISNEFEFVAMRKLHDMIPLPMLLPLTDPQGKCISQPLPGTLPGYPQIERASCVKEFADPYGIEPWIKGMIVQKAQAFDGRVTDGMRFVQSKADTPRCNLDIEAMSIDRAETHGILKFRKLKMFYGGEDIYQLPGCVPGVEQDSLECFKYVNSNETLALLVRSLYKKVDTLNPYVGILLDEDVTEKGFSLLAAKIIAEQINRSRHGDFWWFENYDQNGLFSRGEYKKIRNVKMVNIVERNSQLEDLPDNVFKASEVDLFCQL